MENFPEEILRAIFSFLPFTERLRLERVCKQWRYSMPYTGVKKLDLVKTLFPGREEKIDTLPVSSALRSLLKRCGHQIEKLSFGKVYLLITPVTINLIEAYCPKLKELDLSFCTVTESLIPALIPFGDRLQSLDLGNTSFSIRDSCTHADNMYMLFSSLTQLRRLNLRKTSVQNFSALPFLPPSIRSINLNQCGPLRSAVLLDFFVNSGQHLEELRLSAYSNLDGTLVDVICNITTLKILELSHLAFSDLLSHENLSGLDFSGLASLVRLEGLYVQYNNAISDHVLRSVCASCAELRVVNLAYNRRISDFTPLARLLHLNTLHVAATERFSDIDLRALSENGQLRVFHATNCPRIGASGLRALINNNCAHKLQQISLAGQWESETVSDDLLTDLFALCPKLESLTLHGCQNLTDGAFVKFPACTLPPQLQTLDLSFCSLLTDDTVSAVSQACAKRLNWPHLTFYVHQTKVTRSVFSKIVSSLKIIL